MDEFGPYRDAYTPDAVVVTKGCCVRFYEDGPEIHANSTHISIGVKSVCIEASTGYLRIDHDQPAPVLSISPILDETLSQRELTVGPSGGGEYTRLVFAHWFHGRLDLRKPEHYALLVGPTSNLWYSVTHVLSRGGEC